MHKKELVMHDTQVGTPPYLLEEVLLMDQKGNHPIKLENLISMKKKLVYQPLYQINIKQKIF